MADEVIPSLSCKEIKTTKFGLAGTAAQGQTSGADQAACPAGGVGAAAGGFDTANNRDKMIALLNEIRTTLVNNGMMKGSS